MTGPILSLLASFATPPLHGSTQLSQQLRYPQKTAKIKENNRTALHGVLRAISSIRPFSRNGKRAPCRSSQAQAINPSHLADLQDREALAPQWVKRMGDLSTFPRRIGTKCSSMGTSEFPAFDAHPVYPPSEFAFASPGAGRSCQFGALDVIGPVAFLASGQILQCFPSQLHPFPDWL